MYLQFILDKEGEERFDKKTSEIRRQVEDFSFKFGENFIMKSFKKKVKVDLTEFTEIQFLFRFIF